MKYQRVQPGASVKIVPLSENGGNRKVTLIPPNTTFHDLKMDAKGKFFPQGKNFYGEDSDDVIFSILSPSGEPLNAEDDVGKWLNDTGNWPSKTTFVFQSERFNTDEVEIRCQVCGTAHRRCMQQMHGECETSIDAQ